MVADMANKTTVNAALIAVDSFGFVMLIIKWLSRAEFLQGLGGLVPLFHYQAINWASVYLLTCCLSTSFLVALNIDFLSALWFLFSHHRKRTWDAADKNIIAYIYDGSLYGTTFPYERRVEMATSCFLEALRSGQIKAAARKAGRVTQTFPSKWDFEDLEFVFKTNGPPGGYQTTIFYAANTATKKITFESIMCDWRQIKKKWPEKRR